MTTENTDAYVPYADDTFHSLFIELQAVEKQIQEASADVRAYGIEAINAKNNYELKKNQELVQMTLDEANDPELKKKRTDTLRQGLYRNKFATERIAWTFSERQYEIAQSHLKALLACAISIQSRGKLLKPEFDFHG